MSNLSTAPAVGAVGRQTAAHNAAVMLSTGHARIIRATGFDAPAVIGPSAPSSPKTPGPVTYHSTGMQSLPPPTFDAFVEIHGRKPTNVELEYKTGRAGLGRYPTANAYEHRYGAPVEVQRAERKSTYVDSGFQAEGSHRTRSMAIMQATVKAARIANTFGPLIAELGFNIIAESRVDHVIHSEQYPCDIQLDDLGNVKDGVAVDGRFLPNLSRAKFVTQSAPPIPPASWRPELAWEPENGMPLTQIASVRPSLREDPPKPAVVIDLVMPPLPTIGYDGRPMKGGEAATIERKWAIRTQGLLNLQSWDIGEAEDEAMERYEAYDEDPFGSFVIPPTPLPPRTVATASVRKRKSSAHHDTAKDSGDNKRARQVAPRQIAPRKPTRPATQIQQQEIRYTDFESPTSKRSLPSPVPSPTDLSPARTSDSGYDTREEDAGQVVVPAKSADQPGSCHYPSTRDDSTSAAYNSPVSDTTSEKFRIEKAALATHEKTTTSADIIIEKDTVNTTSATTSLSTATQVEFKTGAKPVRRPLSRAEIDAKLQLKALQQSRDTASKDVTSRDGRAAKQPTTPKKYGEMKMYVPPTRQAREVAKKAQAQAQAPEPSNAPASKPIDDASAAKVQRPTQELMTYVPPTRQAPEPSNAPSSKRTVYTSTSANVQGPIQESKIYVPPTRQAREATRQNWAQAPDTPTVPKTFKTTADTTFATKVQETSVESQAGAQTCNSQPILERRCEAKDPHPKALSLEKVSAPRGQNKRSIDDTQPTEHAEEPKRLKTDAPRKPKAAKRAPRPEMQRYVARRG